MPPPPPSPATQDASNTLAPPHRWTRSFVNAPPTRACSPVLPHPLPLTPPSCFIYSLSHVSRRMNEQCNVVFFCCFTSRQVLRPAALEHVVAGPHGRPLRTSVMQQTRAVSSRLYSPAPPSPLPLSVLERSSATCFNCIRSLCSLCLVPQYPAAFCGSSCVFLRVPCSSGARGRCAGMKASFIMRT